MRVFVTGATGLLGTHVVRRLREQRHEVVALARAPRRDDNLSWVTGDLLDVASWSEQLSGCEVVFHLAAAYREVISGKMGDEELQRTNVSAPVALYQAACVANVRRFVFVSSAGIVPSTAKARATEGTSIDPTLDGYFESKARAEAALHQRARSTDSSPELVVLRPSMMLGPCDRGPTPAARWIVDYLARRHQIIPPANIVLADARDVAHAVVKAGTTASVSPVYLLGGHDLRFADLATEMENLTGVPQPPRRPPYPLALTLLTLRSWLSRSPPELRPQDLRRMHTLAAPRSSLAEAELAYRKRPWQQTVQETVAWFQDQHVQRPLESV